MSRIASSALIWLLVLLGGSLSEAQTAADYFPLSQGTYWDYTRSNTGSFVHRRTVAGIDLIDAVAYVRTETDNLHGTILYHWYRVAANGDILLAGNSEGDPNPPATALDHLVYPASLAVGQAWIGGFGDDCTVESDSETIIVPAGTFSSCLRIRCVNVDASVQYLAPGVGVVRTDYFAPDTSIELSSTGQTVSTLSPSWARLKVLYDSN